MRIMEGKHELGSCSSCLGGEIDVEVAEVDLFWREYGVLRES
jgi:hypothetical protein